MKTVRLIAICIFITSISKAQTFSYADIFTAKKVYFYGYDFTNFKLIEAKRIGKDEKMKSFIFDLIQIMNVKRDEKVFAGYMKKDTVIFSQDIVNTLNTKINKENIIGSQIDVNRHKIPKDSLQLMINKYDTKGLSGIGFVEIIECFYKPKKETSIWYVFFDISSKKILDTYEGFNRDADSYHGLAEYWSVGVATSMGFYFNDHYKKVRKVSLKQNK